ncbi:MAG: cation:proton antiporter [Gammaproteobacteria bacterium]|jgi:Kef-type K+ transport system membrane component KefB|nr:cation:proton antiporter [Gammaproteobacteria bacterium]
MEPIENFTLLLIGCFLLAGYVAHALGSLTHVPRVILLLLVGIGVGPSGLNLVPANAAEWFPLATQAALSVVGFEFGEKFLGTSIRTIGKSLFIISIVKVLGTALIVLLILLAFQTPLPMALVLAGIAPATAPATTTDVIMESGARGELTDTTLRLVAIDDAWGVILFSLLIAFAATLTGDNHAISLVIAGFTEVFGAIALGVIIGLLMAWVTGRVSEGELTLIETLGFVFMCGGLAAALDLSYILACMSMGCVVSNTARHHTRPFHAIKNVQQPFLIVFFLLAGFHANLEALFSLGLLTVAYLVGRTLGGIVAGFTGAALGGFSTRVRNNIGLCMPPQAGVALGLGLLAAERFPDIGGQILSVVVGTSVIFEIMGPFFTRYALQQAGEIEPDPQH